jgi:hypothetical protein
LGAKLLLVPVLLLVLRPPIDVVMSSSFMSTSPTWWLSCWPRK